MRNFGDTTKRLMRAMTLARHVHRGFTNTKRCLEGHGYALQTAQFAQHCDRSARNGYAMAPAIIARDHH